MAPQSGASPGQRVSPGAPNQPAPTATTSTGTPADKVPVLCAASDLTFQIVHIAPTGGGYSRPLITIGLTNSRKVPCRVDSRTIGVLALGDHEQPIWAGAGCTLTSAAADGWLEVQPGGPQLLTIPWSHGPSSSGCALPSLQASSVTELYVMVAGVLSDPTPLPTGLSQPS